MANYLALIAISKNDLILFLFQQLIKTHSLKTVCWMLHRDFHARHEVTSFVMSLQFLLFALTVTLMFYDSGRTGFTVLLLLRFYCSN